MVHRLYRPTPPRLGPLQPHRHNLFCGTNPFCAPRPLHHRPIRGTLEPGHQGGVSTLDG